MAFTDYTPEEVLDAFATRLLAVEKLANMALDEAMKLNPQNAHRLFRHVVREVELVSDMMGELREDFDETRKVVEADMAKAIIGGDHG